MGVGAPKTALHVNHRLRDAIFCPNLSIRGLSFRSILQVLDLAHGPRSADGSGRFGLEAALRFVGE